MIKVSSLCGIWCPVHGEITLPGHMLPCPGLLSPENARVTSGARLCGSKTPPGLAFQAACRRHSLGRPERPSAPVTQGTRAPAHGTPPLPSGQVPGVPAWPSPPAPPKKKPGAGMFAQQSPWAGHSVGGGWAGTERAGSPFSPAVGTETPEVDTGSPPLERRGLGLQQVIPLAPTPGAGPSRPLVPRAQHRGLRGAGEPFDHLSQKHRLRGALRAPFFVLTSQHFLPLGLLGVTGSHGAQQSPQTAEFRLGLSPGWAAWSQMRE